MTNIPTSDVQRLHLRPRDSIPSQSLTFPSSHTFHQQLIPLDLQASSSNYLVQAASELTGKRQKVGKGHDRTLNTDTWDSSFPSHKNDSKTITSGASSQVTTVRAGILKSYDPIGNPTFPTRPKRHARKAENQPLHIPR